MPKQIYNINQFHGGYNDNSDPRDIAENELSSAKDIMVDELGSIRTMGGGAVHGSENSASGHACAISNGYGLFAWQHDRIDGHTSSANSDDAETGENYLALSDADTTGKVHVYAAGDDTWGTPIDTGQNGTRNDVFYSVDGALRICDSKFSNTNNSVWYGYIDKQFMANSGSTVSVNQWVDKLQYIEMPLENSGWDDAIAAGATSAGTSVTRTGGTSTILTGAGTLRYFETDSTLNGLSIANIYKMEVTVRVQYDNTFDSYWHYTLKAGDATNSTTLAGSLGTNHKSITYEGNGSVEDTNVIEDRVHTFTFAIGDTAIGSGGTAGAIAELVVDVMGGDVDSIDITKVVITEGTSSGSSHDGVDGNNIDTNEIFIESAYESTTGAIGWDKKWEHGFSFLYDEKQESLVRRIQKVDPSSGATSPPTFTQENTDASHAPSVRINVPYDSSWSPRITGGVWYLRDVSGDVPSEWWAQVECNFVKGTGKVLSSGLEFNCEFNPTTSEYNFDIDHENLLQPNQVDTYFSRTGVLEDTESITARFSTSVIVGRRIYIGNVQIIKDDGSKEIRGDAMLKSPVNRFDTFPSSSVVEAAINDGEQITALEEFADRILQFKENTLYIINVSQDIEFLEEVLKYKGVSQQSSVCKTDYGIAWVNNHGCFLYDGKQVTNLLEKGGRKIISDTNWQTFSTYNPMIGYLPKHRQLIVVDDNTIAGAGGIRLYDMVTQSWVQGKSATITSNLLTNFVNDSNGDLVWAHTSGTATMRKWSDTSETTDGFEFIIKDIDFGQPGIRKKLYKVLITYDTGNATSNVQVDYDVDGGTTFPYDFADGTNFASTELASANGWRVAELKPDVSSEANNIKSFRLRFATDGTVPAGFKINDISCIYRMKPIK